MNPAEIIEIAAIIAGLISIPLVAGSISVEEEHKIAGSLLSGVSPENYSSFYTVKKVMAGNKIKYVYTLPGGVFLVEFYPDGMRMEMKKAGEKVVAEENYSARRWELYLPGKYLEKILTYEQVKTVLKTPYGKIENVVNASGNFTEISGILPEDEMIASLSEMESVLAEKVERMKNYTEEITGAKHVEISYLKCRGNASSEYVELYNPRMISVNLEGWKIRDRNGNQHEFSPLIIAPGERIRLYYNQTGIHWNDPGDEAYLINPEGRIISARECDDV